jgi:nucleotide-binding universal stress UspA family protein
MIKSLLVILDDSPSGESAKHLAVTMAKSHKASLSGMGILDEPWIVAPEAIPLGGVAFKVDLDDKVLNSTKHRVHQLEKQFMEYCKAHKIDASLLDTTGVPAEEIEHFSTEFDLIVIGKSSTFHFAPSQDTSVSVKKILKDSPRPILVTGTDLPNQHERNVLVAFDGTFAAAKSLHMAILLGLFKGKILHIATVSEDEELAHYHVNLAAKLCRNHELQVHLHPLVSPQRPATPLLALIEDLKPSLIVMGAYGHSGIRAFFMGSCAKVLLKETEVPLFVFH